MTFTVTYRGADGAVRTEAVEAASRGECFAQMKARGIVPMGVKEGNLVSRRGRRAGGNGGRAERVVVGSRVRRGRIASVILIAGIGGMTMNIGSVTLTEVACALILGVIVNLLFNRQKKVEE